MPDPALISVDLGTTSLKVAAFDPAGALLAQEAARNREHRDGEHSWQDPDEWWADACSMLHRLLARPQLAGREVVGLSLSGRGGAGVFLDAAGELLARSWSDPRHASQLRELAEWRSGGAHLANYAMALLAKLQWLRANEPAAAEHVAHAMYAKDFLLFRLTGESVTDPTSGPDALNWDGGALAHAGVDRAILPVVAVPWAIGGHVTAGAAEQCGVPAGTPVAVGGHDGICANVGAGAGTAGTYAITIGTHAVVRAVSSEHPPGAYRFYGMPPDLHIIGGNAVMAGRAADWFLDGWLDAPTEQQRAAAFASVDAEAATVAAGADGVLFLPFLQGQVAPEARPDVSAAFAGLRARHGRAEMYRAVLEGGAFAIRGIFEQVRGWCGAPWRVRFTGGGAQSAIWRQIIVDALRWPIELTDAPAEGRGAAIYLAVALGYHRDVESAERAMVHVRTTVEPGQGADRYDAVYEHWLALSEALGPLESTAGGTR